MYQGGGRRVCHCKMRGLNGQFEKEFIVNLFMNMHLGSLNDLFLGVQTPGGYGGDVQNETTARGVPD